MQPSQVNNLTINNITFSSKLNSMPQSKMRRYCLGEKKRYINDYLEKNNSIPAFNALGLDPKKIDIGDHFLVRLIQRLQEKRITSMRSIIDALNEGQIFTEEGFNGFIIKGRNNLVLIMESLGKKKGCLSSIYPFNKKTLTKWKEIASYAINTGDTLTK